MRDAPRSELPSDWPGLGEGMRSIPRRRSHKVFPFAQTGTGRRGVYRRWFGSAPRWSIAIIMGVGGLALAPLASLLHVALGGGVTIWGSLAASELPAAFVETGLLLGGVAVVAG